MPCLTILTNLPKSSIPKGLVDKIIPVLAKTVRKPAEKFTCVISGDCHVSFGGESSSPGAVATLESIGHINEEYNKDVIIEITEVLKREMGIQPERFFITFYDVAAENVGKGGAIISEVGP